MFRQNQIPENPFAAAECPAVPWKFRDFLPLTNFSLATIRFFYPVEFLPPLSHSGRDTLLETHLLRI